jgi:transposase
MVNRHIDNSTISSEAAHEGPLSRAAVLVCCTVRICAQQRRCPACERWKPLARFARHETCSACRSPVLQSREDNPSSPPTPCPATSAHSPPQPLFDRPDGCIDQLTQVERAAIVTLHKVGWTGRDIAQVIHCSENTVSLWVNRWRDEHSVADAERSGRPRCTTDDTDQNIGLYAAANWNTVPRDIVRALDLPVDRRTVRRRLNEIDLHTYLRRREHAFTEEDLRRRLSFAEGYANWSKEDWRRVLWSDHTLFTLGHHGREYQQRPPGTASDPKYFEQTERLEGAVWLWGCLCADGLGHAELYDGTLDAARYQSILALNLVKSAHTFWPKGQWWYQQDNASPHTAGTSRAWFHNHGVDLIDFPPWSSDLNPAENLWNDLKQRVYAHHPKTMEELERWVVAEWQATDLNFISHICLNLPYRLQLVLAYKGHKIPY